jgi:hypothetical protein
MKKKTCSDPVVGGILSGWRYDISGIATEMRGDYEDHFVLCEYCRSRQRLHRRIDLVLIALTSVAAVLFLLASVVIWRFHLATQHAVLLQLGVVTGFLISILMTILVYISTPAKLVLTDAAMVAARGVHERLPEQVRNRLPQDLRVKLSDPENV